MNIDDFSWVVEQMKRGPVSRRLVFLYCGKAGSLDHLLSGIEIHRADMAAAIVSDTAQDEKKYLEDHLRQICKTYGDARQEPAVLILENAILLTRYDCNITPIFQYAITPRSAAIFVFPPESKRQLPTQMERWITRNSGDILTRMTKQIGVPDCLITL